MAVAVIGAGISGAVAALTLADKGHRVCLFDRRPEPVGGASYTNEGKIHLGFVYISDPSMKTLDIMVAGAISFRKILERWVSSQDFDRLITEPFDYIVPVDSQLEPGQVAAGFQRLEQKILMAEQTLGSPYLGVSRCSGESQASNASEPSLWQRSRQVPGVFNKKYIGTHFQTAERGVDTRELSRILGQCLRQHPRIELHMNTSIEGISEASGAADTWTLQSETATGEACQIGDFCAVVNCSWEGLFSLNNQVFGPDETVWYHRYKAGLNLWLPNTQLPNFTAVVGPYGDMITLPSGRTYMSWYPVGMRSSANDIAKLKTHYSDAEKLEIAHGTISHLTDFVPDIRDALSGYEPTAEDVSGGIIIARGQTDIVDRNSELHQRYRIGIRQKGSYFSIDTGKYSCGPYFAVECADRVHRESKIVQK